MSTAENVFLKVLWDFPGDLDGKESACDVETQIQSLGVEKIPWRREWLPTPVFLPRSTMDTGPGRLQSMGVPESDRTEQLTLKCYTNQNLGE